MADLDRGEAKPAERRAKCSMFNVVGLLLSAKTLALAIAWAVSLFGVVSLVVGRVDSVGQPAAGFHYGRFSFRFRQNTPWAYTQGIHWEGRPPSRHYTMPSMREVMGEFYLSSYSGPGMSPAAPPMTFFDLECPMCCILSAAGSVTFGYWRRLRLSLMSVLLMVAIIAGQLAYFSQVPTDEGSLEEHLNYHEKLND
jgi:hypothetical protein